MKIIKSTTSVLIGSSMVKRIDFTTCFDAQKGTYVISARRRTLEREEFSIENVFVLIWLL
jgi:hypothetical protein